MKHRVLLALAPAAAAVAIAGCGGGSGAPSPAAAPTSRSGASGSGATVTLTHSKLGSYLSDGKGRSLYLFEADKSTKSTCSSACASIWPPLTASGAVKPGTGVSAPLLSTTKRTDGSTEITYNGHPLYYYVGDDRPGRTTGQGLNQFGAKWYLVAANGNKFDRNGS